MEICNTYVHDTIVFDVRSCPLCEALGKITDLEDKIKDLESSLKED